MLHDKCFTIIIVGSKTSIRERKSKYNFPHPTINIVYTDKQRLNEYFLVSDFCTLFVINHI